jgi:hypothetical protein
MFSKISVEISFFEMGKPLPLHQLMIQPLFRFYSTRTEKSIHHKTRSHCSTPRNLTIDEIMSLGPHALKTQKKTPHQLKIEGITESPYSKTGARIRSSRPSSSASCTRFRSRHHHQPLVHLQGINLRSPCQACRRRHHGARRCLHPA